MTIPQHSPRSVTYADLIQATPATLHALADVMRTQTPAPLGTDAVNVHMERAGIHAIIRGLDELADRLNPAVPSAEKAPKVRGKAQRWRSVCSVHGTVYDRTRTRRDALLVAERHVTDRHEGEA